MQQRIQGRIQGIIQGSIQGSSQGSSRGSIQGSIQGSQIPGSRSCGGDPTEGLNGQLVLKTSIEKCTSDHGGTRGNPGGTRGQPIFQEHASTTPPPLKAIGTLKMQASLGKKDCTPSPANKKNRNFRAGLDVLVFFSGAGGPSSDQEGKIQGLMSYPDVSYL